MSPFPKNRIFSAMQPTGTLHLGNYLGALKNWVDLQNSNQYDCIFGIVDLHAMTIDYDPRQMDDNITNLVIDYLSCGLDPEKSIIMVQSHVPEHTELCWIFNCLTPIAELERMTQFKDKTGIADFKELEKRIENLFGELRKEFKKEMREDMCIYKRKTPGKISQNEERIITELLCNYLTLNAERKEQTKAKMGLFSYPVLMAADILLYKADTVPVGEDQVQHVEFSRLVARKFNNKFGQTFPEPKALLTQSARLMSLADPTKKMAKSYGDKHCLYLTDSPTEIKKKISSAVTDPGPSINKKLSSPARGKEQKGGGEQISPGVKNLFNLLAAFASPSTNQELTNEYKKGTLKYVNLKSVLANSIIKHLRPIQQKRRELEHDRAKIAEILIQGANKCQKIAKETLVEVREKIGIR